MFNKKAITGNAIVDMLLWAVFLILAMVGIYFIFKKLG